MDAAIADASKALALEPQDARAYRVRASAQWSRGALLEAVDDYTKAIALAPSSSAAFHARALCHYARGRWDAALEDLRTSRNLGASDPVHRDLCRLREWMVDLRRQRATYPRSAPVRATEAHLGDLKDPWVRCLAGAMLGEETEPPLELLLTAPKEFKSQADCQAYYYLGFRSLMLNDVDEARRRFERVRDSGRCDFFEHALALHELRQLSPSR
jgi:lipoprotein NlpI